MKVLLWATSLQADILALAFHLDGRPECELLIVTEHAASFQRAPIARLRPLNATVLDRESATVREVVERFGADIVVCDNHFPPFAAAPRVCAMWHGLGWKARPTGDLPAFYKHVERLTGTDPRSPNPRFIAQCYHERDRDWRITEWGLSPESCVVTGSCFADLLGSPAPYSRAALQAEYGLDLSHKTVLINITWHYGRIFPGAWQPRWFSNAPFQEDLELLRRLCARIRAHDANILLCLHDRKRYEAPYLAALHGLAATYGDHICLRHKDEHPDNWADLWIADAMISNLSSFTTFYYHLGRPSIHLCPSGDAANVRFARYSFLGLHARRGKSSSPPWMNDPYDNGGLSAANVEQALAAMDTALTDPDCCKEKSQAWLRAHVAAPSPSAASCLAEELQRLVRAH